MPFPKKPLIQKKCPYCGKSVLVKVRRAAKFKFCSSKCQYEVATHIAKAKPKPRRTYLKCASVFCNKVTGYRPSDLKRSKKHYCSIKCLAYSNTKQYKLDIEALREQKQVEIKHNIWKL